MRSPFLKIFLLLATIGFFAVSCDKDYNELGSSIVDDDHFGFDLHESPVVAYNQFYGPVQTSKNTASQVDMPINSLGYYNNAAFGKVKASFVTQLELEDENPTIDLALDPIIDKVELNIPYFSTLTQTDDDGNHLYRLDSLQGSSKIKLSVYPSGYYLRDFDPGSGGPGTGFQEVQRYYSDQTPEINGAVTEPRLNNSSDPKQNDEFYFDASEIVTYTTDDDGLQVVDERRGPEMRLQLRNDYFQTRLFSTGAAGKLVNNNIFKEWVRGLYFKVGDAASSPNQGTLNKINFKEGTITVTYTEKVSATSTERTDPKTIQLNLAGNTVNLFENEYNSNYLTGVASPNTTTGDDRLWLKGGAGSMAVIRLFEPGQRELLRDNNWLINDASLTFYVDDAQMNGEDPAYRIYLYDLKNKRRLVDYDFDVTTIAAAPQYNKYVHGGIFQENATKRRYTIRLTNHMRNLLNSEIDSTNVELGLVVTETINSTYNTRLKTPLSETIDRIPGATMTSQRGVVLYGGTDNGTIPADKKLKLKIYYTKKD
jgi:hypothetical protein